MLLWKASSDLNGYLESLASKVTQNYNLTNHKQLTDSQNKILKWSHSGLSNQMIGNVTGMASDKDI